jgi:hypothetical protein
MDANKKQIAKSKNQSEGTRLIDQHMENNRDENIY